MKTFRVVAVSSNRNAFGLNQLVFFSIGPDMEAFKACKCLLSPPDNALKFAPGTLHIFPTNGDVFDNHPVPDNVELGHVGMEIPARLPTPPLDVWREAHAPYLTITKERETVPANPKE